MNQLLIPYQIFMLGASAFVLWKGCAPERYGVGTIFAMAVFQIIMQAVTPSRFVNVDAASLGSDLIGFIGFSVIALHARRVWPLWATALQIIALCAHFSRWASISMSKGAYLIMRGVPTAAIVVLMIIATILCILRRQRGSDDGAWQDWSAIAELRRRGR
ncbi:hypothetical protein [Pseudomonas sp.]|uniref:hypothetical protein n=1 Tax=Pseudomonas sp. TaxID=306 RepID=UPI003D0AC70B